MRSLCESDQDLDTIDIELAEEVPVPAAAENTQPGLTIPRMVAELDRRIREHPKCYFPLGSKNHDPARGRDLAAARLSALNSFRKWIHEQVGLI